MEHFQGLVFAFSLNNSNIIRYYFYCITEGIKNKILDDGCIGYDVNFLVLEDKISTGKIL